MSISVSYYTIQTRQNNTIDLIELLFFMFDNHNTHCIIRINVQVVMRIASLILMMAQEMMMMLLDLDSVFPTAGSVTVYQINQYIVNLAQQIVLTFENNISSSIMIILATSRD